MTEQTPYSPGTDTSGICVLIPTYNNAATLGNVIRDSLAYCLDIIVVNDGSTDGTAELLKQFPQVEVIGYTSNIGKGWALRTGLAYAAEKGFEYAISIDSDGQHFAKDIPAFINKIREEPGSLLIGARNMEQASVPGKSSFGNKFSNFWFWVETGIKGPDTQSGFRLYPLQKLKEMRFFTRKFEFEIEVIVKAAWKGIKIDWVPVTVYYAPAETRVSHFRPFKDFSRISVLNTVLVIIAFLYIKPRDFFRSLVDKKKLKALLDKYVFCPGESDEVKAWSVAFGIFMGIVPIWGFQLMVAIPLAILLRLNKAMVIVAANISIPPMIPIILFLSHRVGAWWMGEKAMPLSFSSGISMKSLGQNLTQYLWGSITLAVMAGIVGGLISYLLIKISKKKNTIGRLDYR